MRRAWLQNSRSLVFEFIDKYRELLCRLTMGLSRVRVQETRIIRARHIFTALILLKPYHSRSRFSLLLIYYFFLFPVFLFSDKKSFQGRKLISFFETILQCISRFFATILLSFEIMLHQSIRILLRCYIFLPPPHSGIVENDIDIHTK